VRQTSDFKTPMMVCGLLLPQIKRMMKRSILRRKSIELLKELTRILQEIIGSGDEEGLRRLEETIRKLDESRRRPNYTVH
jgi:hypothetical protein